MIQARDGEEALARLPSSRRPGRPRHDAAEARRTRGLQAAPGDEHGADHHAHGPRRRARQGPRARARRRRLHHEAVLDPRVPQPRPGAAAARAAPQAGPRAEERDRERRASRSTCPGGAVEVRGEPVQLTYVEFELLRTLASHPGRVFSRRSSSRPSGAAPTTATRGRSTSTSATCARSSSATRASRSTSSPYAGSATGSATADGTDPAASASARLALALVLLGALSIVYLVVVPSIEKRARRRKLSRLSASAVFRAPRWRRTRAVAATTSRSLGAGERARRHLRRRARATLLWRSATPTA